MVRIFKTDVRSIARAKKLSAALDDLLWFAKWNFDLEDRDCILRVEYSGRISFPFEDALGGIGIACKELH